MIAAGVFDFNVIVSIASLPHLPNNCNPLAASASYLSSGYVLPETLISKFLPYKEYFNPLFSYVSSGATSCTEG